MNPQRESPLDSETSDFAEILGSGDSDRPVIVGGHAAGLWSRYYLLMGVTELTEFLPFRSKDLDLVGTMELLEKLHRRFKGKLLRSEPRSPVFGHVRDSPESGKAAILHGRRQTPGRSPPAPIAIGPTVGISPN